MNRNALLKMAERWEARARRKFCDAAREPDEMGKRLIEHGAMCYFNCAQEIHELLNNLQVGNIGEIRDKIKQIRNVNAVSLEAQSLRRDHKHKSLHLRKINKVTYRKRNDYLPRETSERGDVVVTNTFQLGGSLSDKDKVMVDYYLSHLKTPNVIVTGAEPALSAERPRGRKGSATK